MSNNESETAQNQRVLQEERQKSVLNGDELSLFIYRTKEYLDNFLQVQKAIQEDPILRFNPKEYSMSQVDLLRLFYKKMLAFHRIFNLYDVNSIFHVMIQFQEQFPLSIHFLMFIPQIKTLGTDEQVNEWMKQIERLDMIGCYAQTELGHGSDIQSLETTATYDKYTQEFIINTPSIKAAKFWPGDLGHNANYAIVMAQLIIDGKSYGVQSFLVQLRDIHTHKVLQGIEVGDIGPKLSYNIKDNGYAIFKNVRITRMNMLMRYVQVSPEGQITRSGNQKIAYATMMLVRSFISRATSSYLAQALTIAIRYSIYRTQFKNDSGNEIKLLDYQLQMNKLLPNLATTYAVHFGGIKIRQLVQLNQKNIQEKSDFSLNPVIHCLLSGTKAFYSWINNQSIELIRQACGGQGFSMFSGIPSILLQIYPNITLEGENTVIAIQCSRYIIKSIANIHKGKAVHQTLNYLNLLKDIQTGNLPNISIQNISDLLNIHNVGLLLKLLAAQYAGKAYNTIGESIKLNGKSPQDAMNRDAGISMVDAADIFISLYSFESLVEAINQETNTKINKSIEDLALLYGIGILLSKGVLLYELGIFGKGTQKLMENTRNLLFNRIRPNALVLVEAWQFSDNSLRSAIGSSDGSYEKLFDWVKNYNLSNYPDNIPGFDSLQQIRGKPFKLAEILPKL